MYINLLYFTKLALSCINFVAVSDEERPSNYAGEERCIQGLWQGRLRERDHLEMLDVNGDKIKLVLMKSFGRSCSGLMWLRIGDKRQASGSIKCGDFRN